MTTASRTLLAGLCLCAILTVSSCNDSASPLEQERQARIRAEQVADHWKMIAGVAALVALLAGVAMGSRPGKRE